jgi:hypothetical protein
MTSSQYSGLKDSTFAWKSNDYDYHEQVDVNGVSMRHDYGTDSINGTEKMVVENNDIIYEYVFDKAVNFGGTITSPSYINPIIINLMGKPFIIVGVGSSSIKALNGITCTGMTATTPCEYGTYKIYATSGGSSFVNIRIVNAAGATLDNLLFTGWSYGSAITKSSTTAGIDVMVYGIKALQDGTIAAVDMVVGPIGSVEKEYDTVADTNSVGTSNDCFETIRRPACKDSDGGMNFYVKGTTTDGITTKTDQCDYCTGACGCPAGQVCPPCVVNCGAVKEYYCSENGISETTFVCPTGNTCRDGACVATASCTYGTASASNAVQYGNYKIYATQASSSWVALAIKNLEGSTIDSLMVSGWSPGTYVTVNSNIAALTVTVSNIAALQDGTVVGADLGIATLGTICKPTTTISLQDTSCSGTTISTIIKNDGSASINTGSIKFYAYPEYVITTQTTNQEEFVNNAVAMTDTEFNALPKPTATCVAGEAIPSAGCVIPTNCDKWILNPGDTSNCHVSGYAGINTVVIIGPSNKILARVYCAGGTKSCQEECGLRGYSSSRCSLSCDIFETNIGKTDCGLAECRPSLPTDKCSMLQTTCCCSNKAPCPYECCEGQPEYYDRICANGCKCTPCVIGQPCPPCLCNEYTCENNQCVPKSQETYVLSFKSGWNLFSLPEKLRFSNPNKCTLQSQIWTYQNGNYVAVTGDLQPGVAYWAKVKDDCEITVTGYPITIGDMPRLTSGWNMLGSASQPIGFGSVASTCEGLKGPYAFDSATQSWYLADTMQPGVGYFLKVANDCGV